MDKKTVAGIIGALFLAATPIAAFSEHSDHVAPNKTAMMTIPPQPSWEFLSIEQRTALSPLGNEWDQLDSPQRRKWLNIAERYKKMNPEQRERLQDKMRNWALLSHEQRYVAREQFKEFNKLSPHEKELLKKRWIEYSQQRDAAQKPFAEQTMSNSPPTNASSSTSMSLAPAAPNIQGAQSAINTSSTLAPTSTGEATR